MTPVNEAREPSLEEALRIVMLFPFNALGIHIPENVAYTLQIVWKIPKFDGTIFFLTCCLAAWLSPMMHTFLLGRYCGAAVTVPTVA